ncbi:hypothetical protein PFISCL1PPCAC_4716 [Pristionchus fissidentatus]|uniref:Transmembrane protein n=1 Tax=Pristionchus fissidentatus TaxID=1538716 RepID=A0AAV5V6B3_9BILA|nr:hypothetical protein PFISCL1PPCAC_4716 [Pristionchus fissidentatus]
MNSFNITDVWQWVRGLLEPLPSKSPFDNDTDRSNRTFDVFCANCVANYDKIACIRAAIVAFLGVLTAGIAIGRVFSLHSTRRLSPLKLFLYYLLVMHLAAGSLEWIFGWTTQITLFISYAKAVELLIVCYFYLDVATRMMQWNTAAGKSLTLGSLFLMFTFFTLFVGLGFMLSIEPWTDCHAPYWIWFSLGQLLTVQLMVSSFLMIIHRINRMSATPSIRRSQRTQILCLLYVYEISALADCAWHVSMYMMADEKRGCSGIFNHNQLYYTGVKLPYDFASFLMPVWAILYVFRPTVKTSSIMDEPESDDESMSGSSTHSTTNIIVVRNWQRRYRPLNTSRSEGGYRTRSEDRNFVDPSRQVRRARRAGERGQSGNPPVRRVSSAPSIVPPTRRHSVSRSLISSPLYPIPEEPFITHSYQNRFSYEDDDDDEGLPGSTITANSSMDNMSTSGLVDGER